MPQIGITKQQAGLLFGKGKWYIKQLQASTHCRIQIYEPKILVDNKPLVVTIEGSSAETQVVLHKILSRLKLLSTTAVKTLEWEK